MKRQRTSQRRERTTSTRGGFLRGAVVLGVAGVTVAVMLAFLTPAQGSELLPTLSPSPSSATSTDQAGAAATPGTTDAEDPTGSAASGTPSRSTQEDTRA